MSIHSFSTGIIHRTYDRRQPSVRSQIGDVCRGVRVSRPRRAVESTLPALPGRAAHAPRTSRPRSQDEPPTLPRGVTRWSESVPPSQAYGAGFLESPCMPSPVSSIRTPRPPLLPLWEKGVGGMRGKRARERRREKGRQDSSREHAARAPMMGHKVERGCPDLAGLRGRFFGKPRRAISRFRQQDAQTPPSPLVGEGGRGDEGQTRTGTQKGKRASG